MNELVLVNNGEIQIQKEFMEELVKLKQAQLKLEAMESNLRDGILEAMKETQTIKFENDFFRINYKAPYVRNGLDTTRIKKELPWIADEYAKQTEVKESISMTWK